MSDIPGFFAHQRKSGDRLRLRMPAPSRRKASEVKKPAVADWAPVGQDLVREASEITHCTAESGMQRFKKRFPGLSLKDIMKY